MNRLSYLTLAFAIAFAIFFIGPPLLSQPCRLYPLMKVGDVLDILTPLVLIPLYWLLYRACRDEECGRAGVLAFLVLAALWVEGQGMHLSANSIGHLVDKTMGDLFALTYFYDETLSHYLWHFGVIGLSALILFREWRAHPAPDKALLWPVIAAGLLHGFTLFTIVIEGGTAPLGITSAVVATVLGLGWGRKRLAHQPVLLFFFLSYVVATLLFAGWGIYWGGFPQFSELGII